MYARYHTHADASADYGDTHISMHRTHLRQVTAYASVRASRGGVYVRPRKPTYVYVCGANGRGGLVRMRTKYELPGRRTGRSYTLGRE